MPPTADPDWRALVQEHGPLVLALCARSTHDPDDAYQEAWARIYANFHKFDDARGSMRTWIATVTRRTLIDRFRHGQARGVVLPLSSALQDADRPDRTVERLLEHERLEAAIARLPPDQRHVVLMHHLHGVSLTELAAEAEVAVGTIKSRLHRGRAALILILGTDR